MGFTVRRIKFSGIVLFIQAAFIVVMGLLCEYPSRSSYGGLAATTHDDHHGNDTHGHHDDHHSETTVGSYNSEC